MFLINNQSKNEPNFQPPSPTKVGRDIAWVAPIIGCPFPGEGGCPRADGAARHPYHKIGGVAASVPIREICGQLRRALEAVLNNCLCQTPVFAK
jgi:hypothetical protein